MATTHHDNRYTSGGYLDENPDWHDEDAPVKAREIDLFLRKNDVTFDKCADIGCGTGRVVKILASSWDAEFHGYDITALPSARDPHTPTNVTLVVGDFFSVNLLKHYDLILLNDVIEHIPDFFNFLNRLKKYSRCFIIRVPIEMNVLHTLTNRQIYNRRRVGHLHYFSKDTALAFVEECSLRIVAWQYVFDGLNMPHTSRSVLKLVSKAPRLLAFRLFPDLGVRLFGGAAVLILAVNDSDQALHDQRPVDDYRSA